MSFCAASRALNAISLIASSAIQLLLELLDGRRGDGRLHVLVALAGVVVHGVQVVRQAVALVEPELPDLLGALLGASTQVVRVRAVGRGPVRRELHVVDA